MYSQMASTDFYFTFRAVVGGKTFIDDLMNIDNAMDMGPPEFYHSVMLGQRRYAYVALSRSHRYRTKIEKKSTFLDRWPLYQNFDKDSIYKSLLTRLESQYSDGKIFGVQIDHSLAIDLRCGLFVELRVKSDTDRGNYQDYQQNRSTKR
ncbi:hypothetical protein CU098_013851 [Rhizopus stolonifer]|uniref:Uncharacterized protein n=1 Tax=Rhizopus stolonifer TaxID=4846 RepID=A0A367KY75_RHIST|nr:hypothetical protein CU098_013851 [Rhizopus stolonifer]